MNKPTPPALARVALRRLTAPHAVAFGSRLLDRGSDSSITFQQFVDVARELVATVPEQSAVYLAALVALDMSSEDDRADATTEPSPN